MVKRDLLDEYGEDFFTEYEEVEEGESSGMFEVHAVCPEGEEMSTYIEELVMTCSK